MHNHAHTMCPCLTSLAHAEAEGDVMERPAKATKYGNMVLDNCSKGDDTPEMSRKKVKRPRLTEGPKDPKDKTCAPPAEVPVASSSMDVTMGTSVIIAIVVIISLTILFLEGHE